MSHFPRRLNTRQRIRNKPATTDKGWNTIPMAVIATTDVPKSIPEQYVGHCCSAVVVIAV
jgi:hypothetical protein